MSIVRKIVGWVGGSGFISLARNTHRATEISVVAAHPFGLSSEELKARVKAAKLSHIVFRRNCLKNDLEKAKRLKLRRRHIYAALEALRTEELKLESGQ